jgi:hypothetical protein
MDVKQWEREYLVREYGPIPNQCPRCHASRIARVVWIPSCWGGPLGSAIRDGEALLVGEDRPERAPDWVCLACEPGWEEAYRLTQEVEALQLKQEDAVGEEDYQKARNLLDRKDGVMDQRLAWIVQLLAARSQGL